MVPEVAAKRNSARWRLLQVSTYGQVLPGSELRIATNDGFASGRPVDIMDKAGALPTSPQAQQHQQDVANRILAA
jgi:hypothetical protein